MSDLSLIRHLSIFNPTPYSNTPIHIIGAGATGSRIWLALVELGLVNIQLYDFDHVAEHNLSNQIYLSEDVDKQKVEAAKDYYTRKTGKEPLDTFGFHSTKIQKNSKIDFSGIVFLLTDTMASRKEIFDAHIENNKCFLMIETRMASSYGNVNTLNPFNEDECLKWKESLIDDDAAEMSACGSSISVGPTASIIANLAVWQMIHALTNPEALDDNIEIHLKPLIVST